MTVRTPFGIGLLRAALFAASLLLSLQPASSIRASSLVQNSNAVSPAEFVIDPPTLINLGFEWFIEGDANRNASVDVSYRKQGSAEWKPAMPLLRLQGEHIK